jgi:large repetitive protein
MKTRRTLKVLLAAAALSSALAADAQAAKPVHVSCGETITTDTTLANDLTNCPRHGIVIGADDITLDLNGHTIDGDDSLFEPCPEDEPCDAGIANSGIREGVPVNGEGYSGVTIKHGFIRDFPEEGVYITHTSANRVTDIDVAAPNSSSERAGVILLDCRDCRIDHSSTSGLSAGIVVERSRDVEVANNHMHHNEFLGLIVPLSQDVRVAGNAVSGNGGEGILLLDSNDNTVERNSLSDNAGGIVLAEGSDRNVVKHNSSSGNLDGIVLDGSNHNLVATNSLRRNSLTGVFVFNGDDNVIARNVVVENSSGSDGPEGGIRLFTDSEDPPSTADRTLISRNKVADNALDGILVDAGNTGTVLEGNRSKANGDDGFDVESVATTLTENIANSNHDLGIEAVPGVSDGGGNRASGNGNPLQCTNLFCN